MIVGKKKRKRILESGEFRRGKRQGKMKHGAIRYIFRRTDHGKGYGARERNYVGEKAKKMARKNGEEAQKG